MKTIDAFLREDVPGYFEGDGRDSDVVLASRVRLARNCKEIPFPNRASENQLAEVQLRVEKLMPGIGQTLGREFYRLNMEHLSLVQRGVLAEKAFISPKFMQKPQHRVAFISEDERISLLINEEDHLRIQCMAPGFDLATPAALASKIDDLFEAELDVAFDEKMGYLTSCPTNLGTGLRAVVLLHLPGLTATKNLAGIVNLSPQLGLAVRPIWGNGKENAGDLYYISNQLTLGFSEAELLANMKSTVQEIIEHEREARKSLAMYAKDGLEDDVWRAYGTLRYARSISEQEAMRLLSKLRLGVELKLLHETDTHTCHALLTGSQPAFLKNLAENENLSKKEIDRCRAKYIRERLDTQN